MKDDNNKEKKEKVKLFQKLEYEKFYLEKSRFDLENYEKAGNHHFITEIIMVILMVVFFGYGIYHLYFLGGVIRDYATEVSSNDTVLIIFDYVKDYALMVVLMIILIYVVTLWVSYIIVKFFSNLAAIFIYGSVIAQIVIYGLLYYNFNDWQYRWLFLIPLGIQLFILVVWRKKLQLAIQYVKFSGSVVWEERGLIIPQILQTLGILILAIFHITVTASTFMHLSGDDSITIGTITLKPSFVYGAYTLLYVFLVYVVLYATLGQKIVMVHHWYRGGNLTYAKTLEIMRRRWRAIVMYSITSSIIHLLQFFSKLMKGEINPTNIKEAAKVTQEVTPVNPMSLDAEQGKGRGKDEKGKRRRIPLHERIWMGLNFFTLPAIAIEDKAFAPALWRSLGMVKSNIVDIYIKHSNVNKLFRVMQWVSIFLDGILGALFGGLYGRYIIQTSNPIHLAVWVGTGFSLFLWIGGSTSALVLNDLNLAYITMMYIHTMDEKNGKEGYTRYELEKQEKIEAKLLKKLKKKKIDKKEETNQKIEE
ncbi:MAG: CTL/SLC44 family protein [archaeon]|nr:CTL/SLC44 family protein [archaeon]